MKKVILFIAIVLFAKIAMAESTFWQLFYYPSNSYGDTYNDRGACMEVGRQNGWKPDQYTCVMVKK